MHPVWDTRQAADSNEIPTATFSFQNSFTSGIPLSSPATSRAVTLFSSIPIGSTSLTLNEPQPSNTYPLATIPSSYPLGDTTSQPSTADTRTPYPYSDTTTPSTFATSTTSNPIPATTQSSSLSSSSQTAATASATATSVGQTTVPTTSQHHRNGLSSGALAAAVVVPLLFVAFIILLALVLLRRRRQNREGSNSPSAGSFLPTMREKMGSLQRNRHSTPMRENAREDAPAAAALGAAAAAVPPVVTSQHNNAYYTGLDTSSHGSRNGNSGEYPYPSPSVEPPPPYKVKKSMSGHHLPSSPPSLPAIVLDDQFMTTDAEPVVSPFSDRSAPFSDPESPVDPHGFLTTPPPRSQRPSPSRSDTGNRSFTSTLYSEDASVHSARAERVVTAASGAPHVIGSSPEAEGKDPFEDPRSPR